MEADALTYFYPEKGWKGEYGFEGFAYNFDNIGRYVSSGPCNVILEGRFPKGKEPVYTQRVEQEPEVPMDGEGNRNHSEMKLARFFIKKDGFVVCDNAFCENGECYSYVNVPFTDRRKMLELDFVESDDCIQHFLVSYDADGKVEKLTVESEVEIMTEDGESDWKIETRVFGRDVSEIMAEDNVKQLRLDTSLIERIYNNLDMVSDSLLDGDERILDAVVICPSSEILIIYNDRHRVVYEYEAAQLSRVAYKSSDGKTQVSYDGSIENIIKNLREANISVIDELLTNPFYNHPASVYKLDQDIAEVKMRMQMSTSVKCRFEVEQVIENASYVDLEHNEIKDFDIKAYKVLGGKASVPRSWDNGKVRYEEVDYGGGNDLSGGVLVPLWRQYVDNRYFLNKCDDKLIFYPIPSLALVKYSSNGDRYGLGNNAVRLRTKTMVDKKVDYVIENEGAFDIILPKDSDVMGEGTIALVAKKAFDNSVRLKVINGKNDYDEENVVGMLDVHVFDPITLKICFVNVNFDKARPMANQWNYHKDRFLEILGQAGVIFNEIDDSKSLFIDDEVFAEFERWDDTLADSVIDYEKVLSAIETDLNTYLDEEFMKKYPDYAGYLRVYILDKCMVDNSNEKLPQYITSLLNDEELPSSSLILFKRSIENSGALRAILWPLPCCVAWDSPRLPVLKALVTSCMPLN